MRPALHSGRDATRAPSWRLASRHLALIAWGLSIAGGFHVALTYQATSGAPTQAHAVWPTGLPMTLDPERATLLLTLHPHCPCSRATLAELDRLLLRWSEALRIHVFVYTDPTLGNDWYETDLWRHAASIPGVAMHADLLGENAHRLGAHVSGTVFLYSTAGALLFEGGITPGRGHEGTSAGSRALAAILAREVPETRSTPAFGCELSNPRSESCDTP